MNGQTPWSGLFKTSVIIPLITLFLGFSLGFYATSIFPVNIPTSSSQKEFTLSSVPQKPTIDESKLPISLSLLTNPIVGQWRGAVEGKLIAKDDNSITLRDDKGNAIVIPLKVSSETKPMAIFFNYRKSRSPISLDEIPLETYLVGDFFVMSHIDKNKIVGGMFSVNPKSQ